MTGAFRAQGSSQRRVAVTESCHWLESQLSISSLQSLFAVEGQQSRDQFRHFPMHDPIQFVQGQVAAMICQAILGEIVGSNSFASVSGTNQGSASF